MDLVDDAELARSSVVANRAMNRTRDLTGRDGYAAVLGFDIAGHQPRRWLDLCCGSGRALIEAAPLVPEITGVDLVGFFAGPVPPNVTLIAASAGEWQPDADFDLITCVHGLHYVGDKLGLLEKASRWLTPGGVLVANLDAQSIRPMGPKVLRQNGVHYDGRNKRIRITGPVGFGLRYLGADKDAGPNYTGQPAVHSYYGVQG
ncbi:ubiquinone/menaquinone biosynthesis C-methylase UbiE [Kibdelosporangium banguiense]|uniref:Ubiquinone/menaquinone biosynthesis C-methylase UbiE n=1 Tax=Kibdelosporangium banguiense TaxID=1365924 RepID=A0ABS4U0V4_9PSEU|nr:class I SAM-dependent methyltransferase [Kibdelosporangium banguiense]MBP2329825.1 ubiquinone/menaquinone biosynthesis C-methylase UbiE [Kibdelosporangium banguiense]